MAPTKRNDTVIYQGSGGQPLDAMGVVAFNSDGRSIGDKAQYTLLTNQNAATSAGQAGVGPVSGGDYIWRAEATSWSGVTATLQFLGLDGTTWYPVKDSANADVTLTANGSKAIGIAQGSFLRVNVTGTPTAMNSALGGL